MFDLLLKLIASKKIRILVFSISLIFIQELFNISKSQEIKQSNSNIESISLDNNSNTYKSEYILGRGDVLKIEFANLEIYNSDYLINKQGELVLPELNNIKVIGLSIPELKNKLENSYAKFIKYPELNITLSNARPVVIFITGEIKKPGLYKIQGAQPKLFNAIKTAEGFTNYADLSNIEISRDKSITQGGGKISTNIDFLQLFLQGDQTKNVDIYDGDFIHVKKSQSYIKDQLLAINKSNIGDGKITVFVAGNIMKQGPIKLEQGSTLIQAISSAGGKKLWTGSIEFISFNYDGSAEKRRFNYDSNAKINSKKNPILKDGDIINVNKTLLGATTEILSEIASPLIVGFGLYELLN